MANTKRVIFVFIGIFFMLVLSGSTCPPGSSDPGQSVAPEWLLRCSHCFATATPPISVPTIESTVQPYIMEPRQCTEQEIIDGCFETVYGFQPRCFCSGDENPLTTATPQGGGSPPPIPTQIQDHYYLVPIGITKVANKTTTGSFNVNMDDTSPNIPFYCPGNDLLRIVAARIETDTLGYVAENWFRAQAVPGGGLFPKYSVTPATTRNYVWRMSQNNDYSIPWYNEFLSLSGWTGVYWAGWNSNNPTNGFTKTDRYIGQTDQAARIKVTVHYDYMLCYGSTGFSIITPEPSPTPSDDEIFCSDYVYTNTEPIVVAPNINSESGSCFTIIPAFSIDTPQVGNIPSMTISWENFKLCPVWIDISSMSILDVVIPMELLIVPFLMFLVTMIMRL